MLNELFILAGRKDGGNQNRLGKVEKKTARVKHFYTQSNKCMEKLLERLLKREALMDSKGIQFSF